MMIHQPVLRLGLEEALVGHVCGGGRERGKRDARHDRCGDGRAHVGHCPPEAEPKRRFLILARRTVDAKYAGGPSLVPTEATNGTLQTAPMRQTRWQEFFGPRLDGIAVLAIARATMDCPIFAPACLPGTRGVCRWGRYLSTLSSLLDEGEHVGDTLIGVGSGDVVSVAMQYHEPRTRNQ